MQDEIEIEVDEETYSYLQTLVTPRQKGEGSQHHRKLAKRLEDPTITQARQKMKAAIQRFLSMANCQIGLKCGGL